MYALDALLCVAEPHVHKPHSNLPSEVLAASTGRCAHRCFLEVASLVLLKQRQLIRRGQVRPQDIASRERSLACQVLVLEKLVQLAEPVGYGDLQAFLPYQPSCVASYWQVQG